MHLFSGMGVFCMHGEFGHWRAPAKFGTPPNFAKDAVGLQRRLFVSESVAEE